MHLSLPTSEPLSSAEIVKLRLAVPRVTTAQKRHTARLLSILDRHEEALAEYESITESERNHGVLFQMARMHRAIGGDDSENRAAALLGCALDQDTSDHARAAMLTEMGDIQRTKGQLDLAAENFHTALKIQPSYYKALRKLVVTQFDLGQAAALLPVIEELVQQGIVNTRLNASWLAVLAGLGRVQEASALRGLELFLREEEIAPPAGYPNLEQFNAELAKEILGHPALRYENSQQASNHSWRVDELLVRQPPALSALTQVIARQVTSYAASPDISGHQGFAACFSRLMPEKARLNPWSIITRKKGYESWHTHDAGWMSGVYYVTVPDGLGTQSHTNVMAGAIEFGWPERLLGEGASARLGNRIIHPRPGMLLLFPSHIHHRTYPHGKEKDRICISFDIVAKN